MQVEIRKERPYWSDVPHDRELLAVHFPDIPANNVKGYFIWVPKWSDVMAIYAYAKEVEDRSWGGKDKAMLKYPAPSIVPQGNRQSPASCGVGGIRGAQQCAPAQTEGKE